MPLLQGTLTSFYGAVFKNQDVDSRFAHCSWDVTALLPGHAPQKKVKCVYINPCVHTHLYLCICVFTCVCVCYIHTELLIIFWIQSRHDSIQSILSSLLTSSSYSKKALVLDNTCSFLYQSVHRKHFGIANPNLGGKIPCVWAILSVFSFTISSQKHRFPKVLKSAPFFSNPIQCSYVCGSQKELFCPQEMWQCLEIF